MKIEYAVEELTGWTSKPYDTVEECRALVKFLFTETAIQTRDVRIKSLNIYRVISGIRSVKSQVDLVEEVYNPDYPRPHNIYRECSELEESFRRKTI